MAELLNETEVGKALGVLTAWRLDDGALVREVELESFSQAIQVVNRVAEIAENDNHHPDIDIRWRTLTFRCTTHSANGLTQCDVSLAQEIDGVIEAMGGAG
ncbi:MULTISPECIES: 4a-hydroxytetrahydrobiopterin dehydratase [Actinokineospora]|uniref:Putative pterin-4-alpha-carbinolamine dehydratase n=1 Tax=Actinokineospora fastidiosa TaxID=1816 RepID=A0A918G191_9PSEU|nr:MULTISPECIES: 4a-hydroxytetrahydrobiopterin dehydratase [Actinokineospora]UVS77063.1 Putative pterin-4-alpha-carbinolamine dehydratase [Actinokineospora sp. UTMC 2448]GGS13726.1 4a-hydroxytetrahydrobiopterin dehydratase [Actinokineospora fastidiosa]